MKVVEIISSANVGLAKYWNPAKTAGSLISHGSLISQLTKRDFAQRYKGSFLGVVWVLLTPLLYLLIYTFVFSVIMGAKWGVTEQEGTMQFALALFCGLIVYNIFSESVILAPSLILGNSSYVTKTVFPIEILAVISVASAVLRAFAGIGIFLLGVLVFMGHLNWTLVLILIPLTGAVLLSLGIGWFLSALGVFVRDMAQAVIVLVQLLFFMTPIVYPVNMVPEAFRPIIYVNPFTHLVEAARDVALWGRLPNWPALGVTLAVSLVVCQLGYMFFMRTKKVFADVM